MQRFWLGVLFNFALCSQVFGQAFDIVIKGGRVIDGTGNPWYSADVGIRDGAIAEIGSLSQASAKRTIDARGKFVTPGFIDMMGSSSYPFLTDPTTALSKLHQGITTMLVGERGSPAPQSSATLAELRSATGIQETWSTYGEYFSLLEKKGLALNVIHNVAMAQVRRVVIGDEDVTPTPEQIRKMRELVAQAMQDGAVGVASALIYPPGSFAKTDELIALASAAAPYHGVYFTHIRNESNGLLDAINEAVHIGEESGLPVHIYHLKAAGKENWPLMDEAIQLIRSARERGIDVTANIYPYIRNGIWLRSFINPSHFTQGNEAFVSSLSSDAVRNEIRREIEESSDWENWYLNVGADWGNVQLAYVPEGAGANLEGLSLAEAARQENKDPWDLFFELVQADGVFVSPKSMNEEQKHAALKAEFVSIATDAPPTSINSTDSVHPRAFGSFPRVIAKYVREDKVISLEEAVTRMTSLPANQLQLFDRGRIAPGQAADVLVFDGAEIRDTATFESPVSYSEGITTVIVNGDVVIDNGKFTGELPGKALRHHGGSTQSKTAD